MGDRHNDNVRLWVTGTTTTHVYGRSAQRQRTFRSHQRTSVGARSMPDARSATVQGCSFRAPKRGGAVDPGQRRACTLLALGSRQSGPAGAARPAGPGPSTQYLGNPHPRQLLPRTEPHSMMDLSRPALNSTRDNHAGCTQTAVPSQRRSPRSRMPRDRPERRRAPLPQAATGFDHTPPMPGP